MSKMPYEEIELKRDCEAISIPHGYAFNLQKGARVVITQALGGSFTVNVCGNLARIAAKDADAIGQENVVFSEDDVTGTLEERIWKKLKTVFDPEIPVNIVDLGLIYELTLLPAESDVPDVSVRMTLTAVGCGMGPVLMQDVRRVIEDFGEEVGKVDVELVFDPPWDRSRISDEAKLLLGVF